MRGVGSLCFILDGDRLHIFSIESIMLAIAFKISEHRGRNLVIAQSSWQIQGREPIKLCKPLF